MPSTFSARSPLGFRASLSPAGTAPLRAAGRVSRPAAARKPRGVRASSEKLDIERVAYIEEEISRQREAIAAQRDAIARQRAALDQQQTELVTTSSSSVGAFLRAQPKRPGCRRRCSVAHATGPRSLLRIARRCLCRGWCCSGTLAATAGHRESCLRAHPLLQVARSVPHAAETR